MKLVAENISDYLSLIGFNDNKIISIRNLRNFCAKVGTNKGLVLVKQKGSNHSTFAKVSIHSELLFYKRINDTVLASIKHLAPLMFDINYQHEILTIEFLDDYDNFNLVEDFKNYKISTELGKRVATLHNIQVATCTEEFGKVMSENYFRSFDIVTPESYNAGGPLFSKCIELMQLYPDLNEGIESFRKEFKWDCFIHGDLKMDNILVKNSNNEIEIKFIDWELVGIGDRYLDLGYIIGNYLLWWIEKMKFSEANESDNDERMLIAKEHMFHFLAGYQSLLINKQKLNYLKLTRFTSIFLLNIFYSKSLFKNKYSKQDVMTLEIARKMLVVPEDIYPELFMKTIMQSYENTF